jgi:hypothetical protein
MNQAKQVARVLKKQVSHCKTCKHLGCRHDSQLYHHSGNDKDYVCQYELVETPHYFEPEWNYPLCITKNKDNSCPDWEPRT